MMHFLCLPGAYGSADKFQVQLAPILKELLSDNSATFYFTEGPCEATPPLGFEAYFGGKPYYRFMAYEGPQGIGGDILERIRDFPEGVTAEDTMRELMSVGLGGDASEGIRTALNYLYRIMEDEGPFDGIIGYSEGATVAATLLLDEQQRLEKEGRPPMIKCAVFFAGWPPVKENGAMVLADESDLTLDVPTCHVVGCQDPYLPGSMALYNICNPDNACIFDHGKGHTLPRDKRTVKELGNTIRRLIADVS